MDDSIKRKNLNEFISNKKHQKDNDYLANPTYI